MRPTDIAIVGVGLRFAGGVHDLDSLWRVVLDGVDVTSEVPADRWDKRFHGSDPGEPGTMYCTRGGFLDEIDRFDARFFGITPREAAEIDPQQRLLLETAWAAMEDSGVPRERWAGSRTGVFAGILNQDYTLLHAKTAGASTIGPHYASGKEASFGVGRIAYTFGLHGPTLMVNSACSSSLLAIHLAARSLSSGESDTAIAGGVNIMVAPELNIFMSKIEALSPSQRCRPFDAAADGVVRGEGCGMVVLKRYADAVAAGDRVYAVIEGSATNHDGHSAGLIAPNPVAQEMLLRSALADAELTPEALTYVEAHGTGTVLGDQIEVGALVAVLGGDSRARPLLVGSHKANFGHCDSAAGVLGLLKAMQVARHGVVPPQINVTKPMHLLSAESGVVVAVEPTPLPGDRRHVGVSAFGLSGTNVHVVLSSVPTAIAAVAEPAIPVLLVSGPTPAALTEHAAALREREDLTEIVPTAAVRRTHHDHRLAVVGSSDAELAEGLDAFLRGAGSPSVVTGDVLGAGQLSVVHTFSGQGSQWPGMGMDLYREQPLAREVLDECDALVHELAGWSVLAEIAAGTSLPSTRIAQPAIFAVQVALSRLWASWGLPPAYVVGHSVGEVAAAHVAGTLDLRSSVRLVVERGRIMEEATGSGRMASVELPVDEVQRVLADLDVPVEVATVNGPRTVVIAGPADAVTAAVRAFTALGVTCQPLAVDYAFHTAALRSHGDALERLLGALAPAAASVPMLSSVEPGVDSPVPDAAYWGRNVRETVRFWPAVDRLLAERDALFVEIGPHPTLTRPLRAAMAHRSRSGPVVYSLMRGRTARSTLATSLAALYPAGAPVDWESVQGGWCDYVPLPPVRLTGERHWLAGVPRGEQGGPGSGHSVADLRAEVRLFDGNQNLVATLGEVSLPAAQSEPARPAPAPLPSAQPYLPPAAPAPAGPNPVSSPTRSPERTARTIGRIAAEVLGVGDQRLSRVRGFYELGFDSFSLVELVNRLKAEFGVALNTTAGIDFPSIDAMAEHITGALDTGTEPEPHSTTTEPIAIVGMGCRLPGATGLDAYWQLLANGVDATSEVPADRWDAAGLLADGPVTPGSVSTHRGAFVDGIDQFDNEFFRISAREARSMDPQQRLFLEVAWEALEDAGLDAGRLGGGRTGLFVGLNTTDYQHILTRHPDEIDLYYGTGNSFSGSAGRMSYFLGVRGPSLAVDTACASSLTAVHLGVQSLRAGESDIAIVGGANAIVTPTVYLAMSAGGALSPDGRCKTFDASADGYGRGEGAGALVLKTLSQAQKDGDRVYAVINGSAVNHNGASGGLTVPSAAAQAEVIRTALAQGGVAPEAVDYVEAHGTGTALGDPVELTALDRALGDGREDRPLLVGSVKTNIAHLEAAAGVAGLIKTVLALRHNVIPRHLHFADPSPQVPWDRLRLRVAADGTPWPARDDRPRVAGVSAFGFTGTNAHVVLSEAPPAVTHLVPHSKREFALPLSGATPDALDEAVDRIRRQLATADLADLCHTLGARRTHLAHRLVVVGSSGVELVERLASPDARGSAPVGERRRYALVFGDDVGDLPWDRLNEEPAFATALDEIAAAVGGEVRATLPDAGPVAKVAAQIAMATLWHDHGLRPDVIVGQGIGELSAAYVAGALSLVDALRRADSPGDTPTIGAPTVPLYQASRYGAGLVDELSAEGIEATVDVTFGTGVGLAVVNDQAGSLVRTAAALHVSGFAIDWPALLAGRGRHVSTPGYPWQHRRHWTDAPTLPVAVEPVAVLGAAIDTPGARYYPVRLTSCAASDVVETLVTAAGELLGPGPVELLDVALRVPVAAAETATHLVCRRTGQGWTLKLAGRRHTIATAAVGRPAIAGLLAISHAGTNGRPARVAVAATRRPADDDAVLERIESVRVFAPATDNAVLHTDGDGDTVRVLDATGNPLAELTGAVLRDKRDLVVPADLLDRLASRLYRIDWQPAVLATTPPSPTGSWLIAGDTEVATHLAEALGQLGAKTAVLARTPDSLADWTTAIAAESDRVQGVVLVATDHAPANAALLAAKGVVAAGGPRLWLVTAGAQDIDERTPPDPGQAAASGVVRVLAMEAPTVWGGCVDLPSPPGEDELHATAVRLLGSTDPVEDELALRDGAWYVPRLVHAEPPAVLPTLTCRPDAWYAVIGDPTHPVVDRLVAAGARRFMVSSGTVIGAEVKPLDAAEPIAGVVVAPTTREVRPLRDTEHLDLELVDLVSDLVTGRELEFCVVTGSAAALWASAGMAAQGAVDAALDAVVAQRTTAGLTGTVLRWMPMVDDVARRDRLMMENSGLTPLTRDDVAESADVLLRAGLSGLAVARVDETRFAHVSRAQTRRGVLDLIGREDRPLDTVAPHPPLVAELLALEPELRLGRLLDVVLRHVAEVLGGDGDVDPDRGYFELGMDSVMAIALKTRLDDAMGVDLPATLTFEFPTGRALALHLLSSLPHTEAEEPQSTAGTVDDELDALSDEQLLNRLLAGIADSEHLLAEQE